MFKSAKLVFIVLRSVFEAIKKQDENFSNESN